MVEAICGLVGALLGGGLSILGNWWLETRRERREQERSSRKQCCETLRQICLFWDKLILFSGSSSKAIHQMEADPDLTWEEIRRLRRNLVADILVDFDPKTLEEFYEVFDDVYNCCYKIGEGGEKTGFRDISDEVEAFVSRTKKRYSIGIMD